MKKSYFFLRRYFTRFLGVFILKNNNFLGYVFNASAILGESKLSIIVGDFFCKVISNRLLFAAIYPVVYDTQSEQGDRLQNHEILLNYSDDFKVALLGFDKSFIGRLLVWRNRVSAIQKQSLVKAAKKKQEKVLLLTRSWHFLYPVEKALREFSDYKTDTLDINKVDSFNENLAVGKNKSKYYREQAFSLLSQGVSWGNFNRDIDECSELSHEKELVDESDIFVVDWLNHNTLWAIENLPGNKPIIVRVHSYEVFSYFPVVLDFGRISGLIFISDGIKNAFYELWGWLVPKSVKSIVLQNLRDESRLPSSEIFINDSHSREKTIGILQYAEPVKDLEYALEVFSELLQLDHEFKLYLAGNPLSPKDEERKKKVNKIISALPEGSVVELGYLKDVTSFFRDVGYILSVSKREGSHESVIEGMHSGCIPVIRDWPLLKPFGGASSAFPNIPIHNNASQMACYIYESLDSFDAISLHNQMLSKFYYDDKNKLDYINFINKF